VTENYRILCENHGKARKSHSVESLNGGCTLPRLIIRCGVHHEKRKGASQLKLKQDKRKDKNVTYTYNNPQLLHNTVVLLNFVSQFWWP